jgi:hypothetical protein
MGLTSYDQIPEKLADYCYVEFTMPATQVSHTTVRSVSLSNGAKDDPPEKYVRYLARHEYRYEQSANVVNGYCCKLLCHTSSDCFTLQAILAVAQGTLIPQTNIMCLSVKCA